MSYLKKIEYEIVLKDSFWVIRNCPKCGRKTDFKNTKKFRVNANGGRLDIWLIYQCEECRQTLNLAIYERMKASSIPKEEYRRFLENDGKLAEMYGKSMQLFRKNRADIDPDRISYEFVERRETMDRSLDRSPEGSPDRSPEGSLDRSPEGSLDRTPESDLERSLDRTPERSLGISLDKNPDRSPDQNETEARLLVVIHNPYGLIIRSEKQIAAVSGLSRSQVKALLEKGEIEMETKGGVTYVYRNGQADDSEFGDGRRNHFCRDGR